MTDSTERLQTALAGRYQIERQIVYALGCVLYETLVGEPPFSGPNAQAIVANSPFPPVVPGHHNPAE